MGNTNSLCSEGFNLTLDAITKCIQSKKNLGYDRVRIDVVLRDLAKQYNPVQSRCLWNQRLGHEYRFFRRSDAECVVEKVIDYYNESPLTLDAHVIDLIKASDVKGAHPKLVLVILRCGDLFRLYNYESDLKKLKQNPQRNLKGTEVLNGVKAYMNDIFSTSTKAQSQKENVIVIPSVQLSRLSLSGEYQKSYLRMQSINLNEMVTEMYRRKNVVYR